MDVVRAWGIARQWLMQSPTTRVGGGLALVLLGISGLFGGLEPARTADRVREVQPDSAIAATPFTLTFADAVAVDEFANNIRPRTPGNHLMVVRLAADNTANEAVGSNFLIPVARSRAYLNRNLVVLDDRLAPEAASVYEAQSDLPVSVLNPGLHYRLELVWEFTGDVPDALHLGLSTLTLRGETVSPDVLSWQDPQELATVTVPVRDNTSGRP